MILTILGYDAYFEIGNKDLSQHITRHNTTTRRLPLRSQLLFSGVVLLISVSGQTVIHIHSEGVIMELRKRFTFLLVAGCLLVASSSFATIHNISVGNFFFSPTNTVASVGDTVRWTWVSGSHSTTSDVGSPKFWDSGIMSSGTFDIVILAVDGPGPFPYHCTPHSATMKDTIFVAAAAMNSPVNPASAPGTDQNNASICNQRDAVRGTCTQFTMTLSLRCDRTDCGQLVVFAGGRRSGNLEQTP